MATMESGFAECEACFNNLVALYILLAPMEMFRLNRYGMSWIPISCHDLPCWSYFSVSRVLLRLEWDTLFTYTFVMGDRAC